MKNLIFLCSLIITSLISTPLSSEELAYGRAIYLEAEQTETSLGIALDLYRKLGERHSKKEYEEGVIRCKAKLSMVYTNRTFGTYE